MRVLLDTNIVLDYLGANQGFTEDAEKVFDLANRRKDIKLVSSSAIIDILYVLRRAVKDRKLVREKYESFRKKNLTQRKSWHFRRRCSLINTGTGKHCFTFKRRRNKGIVAAGRSI